MQRGVRADLRSKNKGKVKRSKSKSRSPSPTRKQPNKNNKKQSKVKLDKNKRNRSQSIARSRSKSKNKLGKSASNKKLGRSNSPERRLNNSAKNKKLNRKNSGKNPSLLRSPDKKIRENLSSSKKLQSSIKPEEKEMGLIYNKPEQQKIFLKVVDALDSIYDKFHEMISNDNDASYVLNALPEFSDIRKEDDTSGRDFISGKITRLSGIFQGLSVDKITAPLKKVPMYYQGPCGKSLLILKIGLLTKFKVQVDLGFLQYSLDGDKITIFRIYISKIYRRMNYIAFTYLECLKLLMEKHPAADRWSIFVLERNQNVHKFFKFLGLKIDKIITDSKVKHQVDYYQEFTIKKKELQQAVAAFK